MDILVPISMKNAAKCDTQCELQKRESSDLWTQMAPAKHWHVWLSVLGNHTTECGWFLSLSLLKKEKEREISH